MKLEILLLGVLLKKPSTGYDLKKYLDSTGRFLRSNTQMSQVYRSLATMEEREWATHVIEPRPGAQDAKTYHPTREGATIFLDWLDRPYSPPSRFNDPDFIARLGFSGFMSLEQVLELIDTELETRRDEVARYRYRDRTQELSPVIPYDREFAYAIGEWAHQYSAAAMDRHLAALEELRRDLLDGRVPHGNRSAALDTLYGH